MVTRGFSMGGEVVPPERNVDNDAPQGMRQEVLDVAFSIAEHAGVHGLTPDRLYRVVSQTLGIAASGNPYAGFSVRSRTRPPASCLAQSLRCHLEASFRISAGGPVRRISERSQPCTRGVRCRLGSDE